MNLLKAHLELFSLRCSIDQLVVLNIHFVFRLQVFDLFLRVEEEHTGCAHLAFEGVPLGPLDRVLGPLGRGIIGTEAFGVSRHPAADHRQTVASQSDVSCFVLKIRCSNIDCRTDIYEMRTPNHSRANFCFYYYRITILRYSLLRNLSILDRT